MIAKDTETSGVDFFHGSRMFFLTTCDQDGNQCFWEADVDPLTRVPQWSAEDLKEIAEHCDAEDEWVYHNAKFDIRAESITGVQHPENVWGRVHDTLIAAHLLASNQPHDLTTCAMVYLGVNIKPYEEDLKQAVKEARAIAKRDYHEWATASVGNTEMPSVKGGAGACDYWLPRAIAIAEDYPSDHPWWTVLRTYSNADSAITVELFKVMRDRLCERGLWEIYLERMKCIPVAYEMERIGVTISKTRLDELRDTYAKESRQAGRTCLKVARNLDYELELPKTGNNNSLLHFCFGKPEKEPEEIKCPDCKGSGSHQKGQRKFTKLSSMGVERLICTSCEGSGKIVFTSPKQEWLKLPIIGTTDSGKPSLDKNSITAYLDTLEGDQLTFVRSLAAKRKRDTMINYADGYERFWLPIDGGQWDGPMNREGHLTDDPDWYVLHPSLNATGTDTLRWSSSSPNEQNISKQGMTCIHCWGDGCKRCGGEGQDSRSMRYAFGPAPGREWWSLDYENIELRIPAYESGEEKMIELFERPDDPPFFGSYHLLNASVVYPDLFWPLSEKKGAFKDAYNATWYKWCKNGGFAIQYGCQERKADQTFRVAGAYRKIKEGLPKVAALNDRLVKQADTLGYVETMPDRTIGSKGYPILTSRSKWGKVSPTIPLSYHVQSTAMWCTMKGMIRCHEYLQTCGVDARIVMQVHDEMVFDFPVGGKKNLPKVKRLRSLMEQSGEDIGVPLRVAISYHPNNWSEESKL